MLDPANYDPRPLHVRIKEILGNFPGGLTTKELSFYLDMWPPTVSAVVSKLHAYGAGIELAPGSPKRGKGCRWRLKA